MHAKIAAAASFADDRSEAAKEIVWGVDVDYLLFACADEAEFRSLAMDATGGTASGFVRQFPEGLRTIAPAILLQPQLHVLASAGGLNVRDCAEASARALASCGCEAVPIAVVHGDNLLDRLEELILAGCPLDERTTGERFRDLLLRPVFATAWLGAGGLVAALEEGARVVIGGTQNMPVLTTAAAIHAHNWTGAVFDHVANVAVVGRTLQVGSAGWKSVNSTSANLVPRAEPANLLAEIDRQGTAELSLIGRSDVALSTEAVFTDVAQPLNTPDVTVVGTGVVVELPDDQPGVVRIRDVKGRPPSDTYKATLGFLDGYEVTALLFRESGASGVGADASMRFAEVVDLLQQRLARRRGEHREVSCEPLAEDVAIVSGRFPDEVAAGGFAREVSWLQGMICRKQRFEALSRPLVHPYIRLWQTEVPKALVETTVDCRPAQEWL